MQADGYGAFEPVIYERFHEYIRNIILMRKTREKLEMGSINTCNISDLQEAETYKEFSFKEPTERESLALQVKKAFYLGEKLRNV